MESPTRKQIIGRLMLLGISQREAARGIGVSQGHLNQVLNDKRPPYGLLARLWAFMDQIEAEAAAEAATAEN